MTIISLSGKKQVGKSTIATLIHSLAKGTVKELSFAYALKQEIATMYNVTIPYIENHKDNFRLILQGHGTDYRRALFSKDYWTAKLDKQLTEIDADVVVVTDTRFVNEFNYMNRMGAVMVSVCRPIVGESDNHPSETALDKQTNWHQIIFNTGSIDDLIPHVKDLLKLAKIETK